MRLKKSVYENNSFLININMTNHKNIYKKYKIKKQLYNNHELLDYRKKYILENTFNKSVCLEDDLNWLSSVIVWAEKRAVVLVDGVAVLVDGVVVSDDGCWLTGGSVN